MNTRTTERARGIEVHILDIEPIIEGANTFIRTKRLDLVDKGVIGVRAGFAPWGTFTDAIGNTVVVCNEGVGYHLDDATIPLYAEYGPKPDGSELVSMMPTLEARIDAEYIEEHSTGAVVDLADHIRSFGERLESNFRELHRIATNEDAARRASECEGAHI